MVLAIIILALELIFAFSANGGAISYDFAIFLIVYFAIALVGSAILLPVNITRIKNGPSKGRAIAGTAISGFALLLALIFFVSFLVARNFY